MHVAYNPARQGVHGPGFAQLSNEPADRLKVPVERLYPAAQFIAPKFTKRQKIPIADKLIR